MDTSERSRKRRTVKPSLQRTHSLQGSCLEDPEDLEERAGSYMVEQMLSSMKKRAASSCRTAMVIFRPKTFSRPMFSGTTEDTRTEDGSRLSSWRTWRC